MSIAVIFILLISLFIIVIVILGWYINTLVDKVDRVSERQARLYTEHFGIRSDIDDLARKLGYKKDDDWIKNHK